MNTHEVVYYWILCNELCNKFTVVLNAEPYVSSGEESAQSEVLNSVV